VDPFRMVYLALTTSGTRERAVCVAGDSPTTVADVAGRLAVSAAADECATLLVDVSPGVSAASAYFGWRAEPGFTEAIAGVRLWREVTRPIGASEGLSIDVIPAGSPRQDTEASVQSESARGEFATFATEYDFTILVAPTTSGVRLAAMVSDRPPTILVVRTARTRLQALRSTLRDFAENGTKIHGIVLVQQ
jgi:tyrosine-protein kinase Etk/Wzc